MSGIPALWHPETTYLNTASFGLPPDPVVTTRDLPEMWRTAAIAAGAVVAGVLAAFLGGSR